MMVFIADQEIDHRALELAEMYPGVLPEHREGYERYCHQRRCAFAMERGEELSAEDAESARMYWGGELAFVLGCF